MSGQVTSNNYSQPRPKPGSVSIGDVSISQAIKKEYKRFNLCDKMANWNAIPRVKKTINGKDFWIIPLVNGSNLTAVPLEMNKWNERFKRELEVAITDTNGTVTNTASLPVSRPSGKKAYIHGLSYAAYDFNEMMIQLTDSVIHQTALLLGRADDPSAEVTLPSLVEPDAFGVGLPGLIICAEGTVERLPRSGQYTTASFPMPNWYNLSPSGVLKIDAAWDRRKNDVETMIALNQSAPRASIFHGMLPADFAYNNVSISIIGERAGGNVRLWDSQGRYNATDNNQSNTYSHDIIFPAINNDIDVIIPDDISNLRIEVSGTSWAHHIDMPGIDSTYNAPGSHVKGIHKERWAVTYVTMPLKVQLDLRYNDI